MRNFRFFAAISACALSIVQPAAFAANGPYLLLHDYFDSTGADPPPIPAVVQAYQGYLATAPFDGVAVAMTDSTGANTLSIKVMNNIPLDSTMLNSILAPMANLSGAPNLTQNFAVVFIDKPADFFDDWTVTIDNFGKVAQACKANGLRGIVFDNEAYLRHIGNYPDDVNYPSKTLTEYIAQAQLRGKQIMERMVMEYPDITVLTFLGDWVSEPNMPSPLFPTWWTANELLGPFFVGFTQGMGSLTTHVDGGELFNLRSSTDFRDSYTWRKYTIATDTFNSYNIPVSLRPAWPNQTSIGYGIADRTVAGANLDPTTVRGLITNGIVSADKYVWFYPEQNPYLKSSDAGGAPLAWVDAIRQGKNDGLNQRLGLSNTAPSVSAGSNQTITLPSLANLSGTASDDGLPNGLLTTYWSLVSGPAAVTFGNASARSTTASFSAAGTYVLRFTASDGALSTNATTTITANAAPPVISNIEVLNANTALPSIRWQTDKPSDSQVEYGLTTAYGTLTPLDSTMTSTHTRSLTGIANRKTYHFRVKSRDQYGNLAVSGDMTFTSTR